MQQKPTLAYRSRQVVTKRHRPTSAATGRSPRPLGVPSAPRWVSKEPGAASVLRRSLSDFSGIRGGGYRNRPRRLGTPPDGLRLAVRPAPPPHPPPGQLAGRRQPRHLTGGSSSGSPLGNLSGRRVARSFRGAGGLPGASLRPPAAEMLANEAMVPPLGSHCERLCGKPNEACR